MMADPGDHDGPISAITMAGIRTITAPTLADLQVLHRGRDRLLRVAEVAEHLGVCNATVYRLCERGQLAHVWIVNSIPIRPSDLKAFLDRTTAGGG